MTRAKQETIAKRAVREAFEHLETEQRLERLTAMPDVLERYDAVMARIGRLSIIGDWIETEINTAQRTGQPHSDRLPEAVRFLQAEIQSTKAEQDRPDGEVAQ